MILIELDGEEDHSKKIIWLIELASFHEYKASFYVFPAWGAFIFDPELSDYFSCPGIPVSDNYPLIDYILLYMFYSIGQNIIEYKTLQKTVIFLTIFFSMAFCHKCRNSTYLFFTFKQL